MTLRYAVDAVVLDIEGTTSATGFVVDVLYPYSRDRFAELLSQRADEPEVARAIAQVRELSGEPDADAAAIEKTLNAWLDEDRKATPLKTLQGIIWSEGFARGDLVSHFYDDVVPALRAWHAAGVRLYVYSSGSVAAQRAWFSSTPDGDLLPLTSGLYDTENAGPKQEAASYRRIASAAGVEASRLLFLSDRPGELDAAREAGWHAVGIRRPGEPYFEQGVGDHAQAGSFDEITVSRSTS
ncbi:acireductone synthase [Streptomyces acidiscabies]|uniref:Enolase-phosphatase E1 n=1 Tax=Streptomyces acidiscabies TaxID=42234 RepID=A0AAP6B7N5_9ACTN|nr:acireductone synthase [Streptomyces acidiscabies]MBP5940642.1 acireductone synthase [Streptomyces sp. LBUM 1476]MBZ3911905.1 acireductone synthase [Streptomyces acidiscabies]MDX2959712.1 acireductone synthase [Streptomyces acidiscabies]MDX3022224.1 acireductone synthase [Streptomyces acidiscabies]MDX3792610.1 acireductone synthase [Streptomyces acidiscabies]